MLLNRRKQLLGFGAIVVSIAALIMFLFLTKQSPNPESVDTSNWTPERVAKEWLEAVLNGKQFDHLMCERVSGQVPNSMSKEMGKDMFSFLLAETLYQSTMAPVCPEGFTYDVSPLVFRVLDETASEVLLEVRGEIVDICQPEGSAHSSPLFQDREAAKWLLVREDNAWRWCGMMED
jgi:hypothetical protein